ncbi:MAG: acyl-CoA synthetase FdrA [Candidatus Promineifilaceae bacterium]
MAATKYEVRPGVYYDSVVLMQLQKSLAEMPGVIDAGVVMATPANRELLESADFDLTGIAAKADDLLIVVKGVDETAVTTSIGQVDDLLKRRSAKSAGDFCPHSLAGALDYLPQSQWVLISVPGRYAAGVAGEALDLNQHVFLYSDNVPLEDEIALKRKAREKGLLLMGPDCGTAIINGIGLGFANRVRRGSIGLVAASGTGLQAVSTGIHNLGGGISQAIGTGGRDLKRDVGGMTTLQALDLLQRDSKTDVIVLISKPMDPAIAPAIINAAQSGDKPVVINLIGYPPPGRQIDNLSFASTLSEAAVLAAKLAGQLVDPEQENEFESQHVNRGYLRGLFSGGTLAYEALLGLQTFLAPIYSNIPLRPEQKLADSMASQAHTILDLGEDEFTQGRLHPMIDNDLRLRRLRQEAADPEVGLILLDIVLGEGAHPDPASELAPAIAEITRNTDIEVMAIVLGTDEDPQGVDGQIAKLEQAGAVVKRDVSQTVAEISRRMKLPYRYEFAPVSTDGLDDGLAAINVGLESFYDSLKAQGAQAVHVDWRPPAGGKEDLMAILARMKNL